MRWPRRCRNWRRCVRSGSAMTRHRSRPPGLRRRHDGASRGYGPTRARSEPIEEIPPVSARRSTGIELARFRPRLVDALKGYRGSRLMRDLMAGLAVGIVALPLAMAFAIASGVRPEQGLITAII